MNLLVVLEAGPEGEELLTSAQALSHVSGWPLRVLHVKAAAAAADLELPARLATNTAVEEAVGDPVETILAAAGRNDVVAFAMRHEGEQGVGSVADGLLARAQQTLLVVRPGMRPISSLRRIVVPLEGSPSSSEAMRLTEEAFCGRGREIVVLHVSTADMPDEPGSLPAPRMVDQEQYEWSSWHEEFTMRFATCPEGGRHRTVVRVGDPPEVIVSEATTPPADLIVLAWAGVFKAGRSMFVRAVLEDAPCPLLLVTVAAHT
jgi:nucleotide-binding universal stress UspA family protein